MNLPLAPQDPADTPATREARAPHAAASGTWTFGDGGSGAGGAGDVSGVTVPRIGFGAMRIASREGFSRTASRGRAASLAVLRRAVELGVRHIDTAAFYFSPLRSANELINSALNPYPEDLFLATKVGPRRAPSGDPLEWARPEQLRGEVEENLRQLGRDHLDLVNLRMPSAYPVEELFGALSELREEGLIRHLGLSNVDVGQLARARAVAPVTAVQNRFGLYSRREDSAEVLRLCGELGIAFVPFFAIAGEGKEAGLPLAASATTTPGTASGTASSPASGPASGSASSPASGTAPDPVSALARAHGVTPAQICLAWSLHQGPHVLGIPGTGDLGHLEENVAAGALRLSPQELERLDAVGDGAPSGA